MKSFIEYISESSVWANATTKGSWKSRSGESTRPNGATPREIAKGRVHAQLHYLRNRKSQGQTAGSGDVENLRKLRRAFQDTVKYYPKVKKK